MARCASEEVQQCWRDKIQEQRQSGLSISAWCRENNIVIHTFNYWRDKLFPREAFNRTSFLEIPKRDRKAIKIEYQNFQIVIDQDADFIVLKECLKTLREVC